MKIGIVGGGINGLCAAWRLGRAGHEVILFERDRVLSHTSSASSKLLHGGLRYLEQFRLRLVAESLRERYWWLEHVPQHARELRLLYPIYEHGQRPPWLVRSGLALYQALAGRRRLGPVKRWSADELAEICPDLRAKGLICAYEFSDGQMEERALGRWVADRAKEAGCEIKEETPVERVDASGTICLNDREVECDWVLNMAGPWAADIAAKSGISLRHSLDLIRGSHLILDRPCWKGWMLEIPGEKRIFFVLPWKGRSLVGTTEIRQLLADPIECSEEELNYLLAAYNRYFSPSATREEVVDRFAGVRPLIRSSEDPTKASREYIIEKHGRCVTVLGGKWTTARALGERLVRELKHEFH